MKKRTGTVFIFSLVIVVPLVLWIAWGVYGVSWFAKLHDDNLAALGQAGDLFGGVNALFAAFAFAGVAVAAYFQYRTLTITSTEPLFFHLLQLHRDAYSRLQLSMETHDSLYSSVRNSTPADVAFFTRYIVSRGDLPSLKPKQDGVPFARTDFEPLFQAFDTLYLENENYLGPYYRAFYHVFNLIDSSALSSSEKVRYANIARSTITKDELLLLMLNCSLPRGEGFKKLVEKYGLLKHISTDERNNFLDKALAKTMFHENARLAAQDRVD